MNRNEHDSRAHSSSVKETLEGAKGDPKNRPTGVLTSKRQRGTARPTTTRRLLLKRLRDWLQSPSSCLKFLGLPILLSINWAIAAPNHENHWLKIFTITNRRPDSPDGIPHYAKSYWDIAFVLYYIVFFSWLRECLAIYILKPIARRYGIKKQSTLDRFVESGYFLVYFTGAGSLGLWTMYRYLPTWYFRTEYSWIGYPHWEMAGTLKVYYLLQTANWLQQFILLLLGIEKPRQDFYAMICHHIITLWMVIWSYIMNATLTGNVIFLTMDWSDVFLALSRCFNYLQMKRTKTIAFAWFTCIWTYTRHYLSIRILYSHWYEFDLIAEDKRRWSPPEGLWMIWWMKHQMFFALFALQLLNIFWYYRLWRILIRALFSSDLDERSDDEDDEEPSPNEKTD